MIRKIAKELQEISGSYSTYDIFSDWVESCALMISNSTDLSHGEIWEKREEQYMRILRKHGKETMGRFCGLTVMLVEALEEDMQDVLGAVYMAAGMGNKTTGQFFTPFHLSAVCADCVVPMDTSLEKPFVLYEPSCGGGGMAIAAAKTLKERGLDHQRCLKVVAQDLDWKGVYMTYVQLSLLGIDAVVIQGDSLQRNTPAQGQIFYTPRNKGMLI